MEKGLYKPTFGGFVDVDLTADKKLSLRTLVSIYIYLFFCNDKEESDQT